MGNTTTAPVGTTAAAGTAAAEWRMHGERWRKALRAKDIAKDTERGYLYTVTRWCEFLVEQGLDIVPEQVRAWHVDDFTAEIIEKTSAANAAYHYRNLRVFLGWLVKRKVIASNPMEETEPPNVPDKIIPVLSDEEHHRVLATCADKSFESLRDRAMILLFIDTGLRVSEIGGLLAADIDLSTKRLLIRGKGRKLRYVGFGNSAGLALAQYLRARRKHPAAKCAGLWLTRKNTEMRLNTIKHMLGRRGRQAGVTGPLHAHRFRHDFSDRWQSAGGSDNGLMMIAGWSSTKMPRHYGRAAATRRALAEQEQIGIADSLVN